jgi:class 3 adenylate cyclase
VPSHQLAVHRTIVVVDAEGFSDPSRTNTDQLAVREGLYKALAWSFTRAGIDWAECDQGDCGDGALILVPPHIPKILLVTKWPARLATALNRHNTASKTGARIRLRIAVHAGEVVYDRHGVTGCAINQTFRLVQAPALKEALACSSATYALIASEWIYNEVVRHAPEGRPADYRQIHVAVKETQVAAWLRAGHGGIPRPRSPDSGQPGRRRDVLTV